MTDGQRTALNDLETQARERLAEAHAHSADQLRESGYLAALEDVAEVLADATQWINVDAISPEELDVLLASDTGNRAMQRIIAQRINSTKVVR